MENVMENSLVKWVPDIMADFPWGKVADNELWDTSQLLY